jgi:isopentenyl phosphate kinase
MNDLYFLKLGGSLITDKTKRETPRLDVMKRIAREIYQARNRRQDLKVVLGHGSGSFGHFMAKEYHTRRGVGSTEEWLGFAKVSATASRLNHLLIETMLDAGLPVVRVQPSASVRCKDGEIVAMNVTVIQDALKAGLVPIVYGDVAFDTIRGGTIISTEEILGFLAGVFSPSWLLLAGEVSGVLDHNRRAIPVITRDNLDQIQTVLGGSHGTDVTGGMKSKVHGMLDLVSRHPDLKIGIFSGLEEGSMLSALFDPARSVGTLIQA